MYHSKEHRARKRIHRESAVKSLVTIAGVSMSAHDLRAIFAPVGIGLIIAVIGFFFGFGFAAGVLTFDWIR